jgi:DNA-binding transcriptional MocR family regulator
VSIELKIDRTRTLAIYQQIVEQFKDRICDGRLPAGARLPTVRRLAADLGVTRLTVQNAYSTLQDAGWVEATVGRGTFVSQAVHPSTFGRALTAAHSADAVISEILQVNQAVGLRSLASASPDPRLFPAGEFWEGLVAQRDDIPAVAGYVASQGDPQLRVEISRDLLERSIHAAPDEIVVVAGVTQGLALTAQCLAQPGDRILVERPTYLGLLHTVKAHGLQPVGVPLDADGPVLEELERLIVQERPRFFYTVPTYQNPTGRCMSPARRQAVVDLANAHGVVIVEDDIYARLAYDDPPPLPLKTLDHTGNIVYVSSYSKVLMPGLRLGYLVAPSRLTERLVSLRQATDLCSPPLLQRALTHFLREGGLRRHLRRVLPLYRERRNALTTALRRYLPDDVQWSAPQGGFCTWLTMPGYHAFADLERAFLAHGWAVTPGEVFLAEPQAQKSLRLCFGSQSPAAIAAAVEILGRLIHDRLHGYNRSQPLMNDWAPLV